MNKKAWESEGGEREEGGGGGGVKGVRLIE